MSNTSETEQSVNQSSVSGAAAPGTTRDIKPDAGNDLADLIARQSSRRSGWRKWAVLAVVLVAAWLAYIFFGAGDTASIRYLTQPASQGELVVTATATGTIQPTQSVEVGSELSGTIESVFVEENDQVVEGQLLARLDTSKLNDSITKSRAALASAEAQVLQAEATVAEAKATLARMRDVFKLSNGKVPAATEIEVAEAALKRATANESVARAAVMQVQADLKTNETNLSKAQIRSPVDGVVLVRQVEPGNTVVASMSAPVLFTIAQDLSEMELQVNVDEADVATIKPGLSATFTVSAWAGRTFPAEIERVGLGSTTTDNVVTYKTIMKVDNSDLALRPGMTATATVVTAERDNALLVPNAALRYTPQAVAQEAPSSPSLVSRLVPRRPPRARPQSGSSGPGNQVWVLEAGVPKAVNVVSGISNGRLTEIVSGDLKPGDLVIVAQETVQ
ncbi:efflux RND transporter periplasmic adaptor subunit [Orrella marina]|uniref:Efflux RND transporter periplasmic adaptor subunit n=1 Tax=Orrella marina TaxID=2163011 RepID=A0A2R4XF35_9BURK|nr:efflux RND transporter periplasmic adaptor subunit [Orrella marina]AWB32424.1 efflux RND transporter periplasmic adaptor subunit [Orrella marina]